MKHREAVLNLFFWQAPSCFLVVFGLLVGMPGQAEIIPADRMGPWGPDCVGVKGGIPNSSNMTISATLTAGASVSTINNAIAAAASNQVVQLAAGTYNLAGNIVGKSGVVLRGAGLSNTIINFTSGGVSVGNSGLVYNALYGNYNGGGSVGWTAGYSLGSSNLTVSSTSGLTAGQVVCLDQINDPFFVNPAGFEGPISAGRSPFNRLTEQWTEVQTVTDGTHITVWPPVAVPYISGGRSPQLWWIPKSLWTTRFGVENMTVNGQSNGGGVTVWYANIGHELTKECWVKNVKTMYGYWSHIAWYGSFRCEVRHCYAYGTQNAAQTSYGYVPSYTSGLLVEDNIFESVVANTLTADCTSQSVFAYNYATNNYYTGGTGYLMGMAQTHDGGACMLLWEGNHGSLADWDYIHGGGSHMVLFRNRLAGWAPFTYGGGESVHNVLCLQIDPTNRFASSIGNILGTAGKHTKYASYPGNGAYSDERVIYKVGFVNHAYGLDNWTDDLYSWTTFFRHMDYDVVTDGITYNPTNADVTLPASLYLASKPAFFGSLQWPPYNPTNHSAAAMSPTNIPAGYRLVFGADPPAGVVSQPPVAKASATPTNGPAPLAVSFSSAGSYDPEGVSLSYSWTFGDGGSSTAANPSHTYQNAGSYTAQLSVSDGTNIGASPISINVTIAGTNQPPVAMASGTPTTGVSPLVVSFSSAGSYDPEGATLSYSWAFGDGATSIAGNPSHSYAAGTYSAQLRVSDGTNTASSTLVRITVTNPAPTVSLTSPINGASYVAPATINLGASVTPNGHTITKVQFYSGAALLGEDAAAPYSLTLTDLGPGSYSLTAQTIYDTGSVAASSAVTISVGGLAAAYGFEERIGGSTADGSGTGNNGTLSGVTWTAAGRYGNALVFGTNGLVTVNDSASLELTSGMTVEAWVFPTAAGGWRSVIFKPLGTSGLSYVLQASSYSGNVPSFGLSISPVNVMASSALPLNTWSHLAATYDGTTMRLYINGTEVANQAQTGVIATSSDALMIGGNLSGENFVGTIDEVRIYSRPLTASEIQNDMNTPVESRPAPPTGLRVAGP